MEINSKLKKYIEENVFPEYQKNEQGHGLEHIEYVINRSIKFANTFPSINYNIVYTVAAFHDIGHHIDRIKHEIISAEIMYKDKKLKEFFTDEERIIIKEAIEDHRASSNHEPRSLYGKIVATADRNNTIEDSLKRTYLYGKKHEPELSDDELYERSYYHLIDKFGYNGYAKTYLKDDEYEKYLKELRELLSDKKRFIDTQKKYINMLKENEMIK